MTEVSVDLEDVEIQRRADDDSTRRAGRFDARRAGAVVVVGLALLLESERIARGLARLLPWRGEVSSRGSNFESFSEVAPSIVERTGIAVLLTVAVSGAAQRFGRESAEPSKRARVVAVGVVAFICAMWFGWLSTPHNAFPSNARFHWVDYLTWDSDNFFYAAGRIPHILFYDNPFVWQAINVALLVVLLGVFATRIGLGLGETVLLTLAPAYASNFLLFADTSEDVLLNSTLLVGAAVTATYRRPVALGVALTLVVLGRPSFLVIVPCVAMSDYIVAIVRARSPLQAVRRLDVRYHATVVGVFIACTAVAQTLFTVLGDRYFFVNGRFVDTGLLATQVPIEVDGFSISAFSGVFTLHMLWMLPLVVLVGAVVAVVASPRFDDSSATTVYFTVLSAIGILALHESQPLNYYNFRYLTYAWPLLLLAAWVALARSPWPVGSSMRTGAAVALAVGSMVLPADPIGVKRAVESRPETELAEVAGDLRMLRNGRSIGVTFGAKSTTNYLAYIFKTRRERIERVGDSPITGDYIVITQREAPLEGAEPALETESLLVFMVDEP